MQKFPAKTRKEHCTGRHLKGLRGQNGEHLCESKNFDETQR